MLVSVELGMLLKAPVNVRGWLGGLVFCVLGGVDQALGTLARMMLMALRGKKFRKKKGTIA